MIANTITMSEFKKNDSFFNYWHLKQIDSRSKVTSQKTSQKTAEKIAEKIRLEQINKELPEHCFQLLFLS